MEKTSEDLIEFLTRVPLFASVPEGQVCELAGLFEKKTYKKDKVICTQGELAHTALHPIRGKEKVSQVDCSEVIGVHGGNERC